MADDQWGIIAKHAHRCGISAALFIRITLAEHASKTVKKYDRSPKSVSIGLEL